MLPYLRSRIVPSLEICEPTFTDVRVPCENRSAKEGQGVGNLMRIFAVIRVMTVALSLGLARAAFDQSRRYSLERNQFKKRIGSCRLIRQRIGNVATDIRASHLMTYKAAETMDNGERALKEASMGCCANRLLFDITRLVESRAHVPD